MEIPNREQGLRDSRRLSKLERARRLRLRKGDEAGQYSSVDYETWAVQGIIRGTFWKALQLQYLCMQCQLCLRRMFMRVTSAYSTISSEPVGVIAGMMSIFITLEKERLVLSAEDR